MGKRMKATTHLASHFDSTLWQKQDPGVTPEALLSLLRSSGSKPNAHMETLDLTVEPWWWGSTEGSLMGWLQDWVMASCPRLSHSGSVT